MAYLPDVIKILVQNGANVHIEGMLPQTLIEVAQLAKASGARITVGEECLPQVAVEISKILGNQVTFVSKRK